MTENREDGGQEELDCLLAAAKKGSMDARNELFGRLQAYLNYIASRHHDPLLRAKAGISDVVQDALLNANREFSAFQGTSVEQFRGWLRQILINEIRSTRRHYTTQARDHGQERAIAPNLHKDSDGFEFVGRELTPSGELIASEENQRIARLIGKLPEEMRQVIQLKNWEQLAFSEIADRMGITLSQAAKLWYKALLKLQMLNSEAENE